MLERILKECESRMKKAVDSFSTEVARLRTGKATPALLDSIKVEYYGRSTPLKQVANIGTPEPRLIVVHPWDKSVLPGIERAILKSDLGLVPSNDGNVVRITIPPLNEERRRDLVKLVKKMAEEAKTEVRNIRRDTNDKAISAKKSKDISEDEETLILKKVQELTDKYTGKVEEILKHKEKEIMTV
ncbi:MAG: ribosome recycling factor [candidate division Zixibacteria bacterium 4484_93]|nr:MAG: ribosome recycling factor [candidate division Zixibacteria bacterium 4484_93]